MELYKLRYNLYNYLIYNTTDYEITISNKNIWFYGLIAYYTFFVFILLANYNKINLTLIIFIITGMFFLYYCYLLDIAITNIIDNKDFQNYVLLYKLLNAIYIESYKNNKITDILDVSDTYMSLNLIMERNFSTTITMTISGDYEKDNSLLFAQASFKANVLELRNVDGMTDDVYLQITSSPYTLILPANINLKCDILLIGGGGGGASRHGGGGGAGAMVYLTDEELVGGTYTITIGAGGAGGAGGGSTQIANGATGSDTTISTTVGATPTTIYTAKGGGGGGGYYEPSYQGLAGGSSGGSSGGRQVFSAAPVTNNVPSGTYGNLGGRGSIGVDSYWAGGGGGGTGGAGGDGNQNGSGTPFSGAGGIGREINITGTPTYYAGGGGGGLNHIYKPANGGLGGGGAGGNNGLTINANQHAIANTGGGGGGGGYNGVNSGTGGSGGSGIVIIRFSRTYSKITNKLDYITITASTATNKYLRIIVHNINEHYFIRNLVNNIYYKYHGNAYYNLDSRDYLNHGKFFMIQIHDEKIANNPKFYNDVIKYLRYRFGIKQDISGSITKHIARTDTNSKEYLNNFYFLAEYIRRTVKNNENISIYDVNNYIDDLTQNRDILRYIDIYDTSYNFLKRYFFIKNNSEDPIYKYIDDNYEENKNYSINMVVETEIISTVIVKLLKPAASPPTVDYYLIDMEMINNKYYNEEERKNNHNSINDYIVNIYNKLIDYYNNTYNLHIENFDVLYKENKRIDLILKEKIKIYNYLFNIIIAIIIIILTIIMHVFFINIYYNY